MIFKCFIKIHKVKSSKYEWSLNMLAVIFYRWIFIKYTKGTHVLFFDDTHVLYQDPQGEIFKVRMVFRFVHCDIWQLKLYDKHKRDTKVLFMKSIHVFFQNLPGEIFKVWMVFKYVDRDLLQMNLYQIHKGDTSFIL